MVAVAAIDTADVKKRMKTTCLHGWAVVVNGSEATQAR